MFKEAAAGVTMRDGRVGIYEPLKHRHHRHGPSREVSAGSRVPFSKGSPGGGCPQTTGSAHPPRESAKHLLMAAGCQKCLCVTFAKVTKAFYFALPAQPHRRKEINCYG